MKDENKNLKIIIYRPKPSFRTIWANWLFKCEPLEIEYLYTVLKEYAKIRLIDGQVEKSNLVKEVSKQQANILLITSLITNIDDILYLSKKVKRLDSPPLIFVGGPHAEVVPEHFYSPYIDGVFYNNQLEAIKTVVQAIRKDKPYQDTIGAAFPVNGTFKSNGRQRVDYENFPIPDRPLLNKHKGKYNLLYFDDCATMKTSFGCPEKCTFCFCRKMNLEEYNRRPMDSIIEEIETISNKNIFIVDDNFLLSPDRLTSFCQIIEKKNIKKNFIVYSTAHFIADHPELMKTLKNAGLSAVIVGFEFISDKELTTYNKGSALVENEKAIEICQALDIELIALFMMDPEWHPSEFKKLADFVSKQHIFFATFATVTSLPGTDLWKDQQKIIDKNVKWWRFDLLRLHQKPKFMSSFMYYIRLTNLYFRLAYRKEALIYFYKRGGLFKTTKMIINVHISLFDFLLKATIWP